jgi:SAM-dependent methyltransferase
MKNWCSSAPGCGHPGRRPTGFFVRAAKRTFRAVTGLTLVEPAYPSAGIRTLAAKVGRVGMVLDVGCGSASYQGLFPGSRYIGVDVDTDSAATVLGDACALPIASGLVDVALCTEVMEHLSAPEAALAEIRRVLKPTGFLVLSTPFLVGIHMAADYHRWTSGGLRLLLLQNGFDIVAVQPRGGVFSTLSHLIIRFPFELATPSDFRPWSGSIRQGTKWVVASVMHLLLLPLGLTIRAFDPLDRKKRWTLGYLVLAQPAGPRDSDPSC